MSSDKNSLFHPYTTLSDGVSVATPDMLFTQFILGCHIVAKSKLAVQSHEFLVEGAESEKGCVCLWCSISTICNRLVEKSKVIPIERIQRLPIQQIIKTSLSGMTLSNKSSHDCILQSTYSMQQLVNSCQNIIAHESSELKDPSNLFGILDSWISFVCIAAISCFCNQSAEEEEEEKEEKEEKITSDIVEGEDSLIHSLIEYHEFRHGGGACVEEEKDQQNPTEKINFFQKKRIPHMPSSFDTDFVRLLLSKERWRSSSSSIELSQVVCFSRGCIVATANCLSTSMCIGNIPNKPRCLLWEKVAHVMLPRMISEAISANTSTESISILTSLASIASVCSTTPGYEMHCFTACFACVKIAVALCESRGWATWTLVETEKNKNTSIATTGGGDGDNDTAEREEQLRNLKKEDLSVVVACCSAITHCMANVISSKTSQSNMYLVIGDIAFITRMAARSALSAIVDRIARTRTNERSESDACISLIESIVELCKTSIELDVSFECQSIEKISPSSPPPSSSSQSIIAPISLEIQHDLLEWDEVYRSSGSEPQTSSNTTNTIAPHEMHHTGTEMYRDCVEYITHRGLPRWIAVSTMAMYTMQCGESALGCHIKEEIAEVVSLWNHGKNVSGSQSFLSGARKTALEFAVCMCACTKIISTPSDEIDAPWLVIKKDQHSIIRGSHISPDCSRISKSTAYEWNFILTSYAALCISKVQEAIALTTTEKEKEKEKGNSSSDANEFASEAIVAMLGPAANHGCFSWCEIIRKSECLGRWKEWLIGSSPSSSISWNSVEVIATLMSEGKLLCGASAVLAWLCNQCGWASVTSCLGIPSDVINARSDIIAKLINTVVEPSNPSNGISGILIHKPIATKTRSGESAHIIKYSNDTDDIESKLVDTCSSSSVGSSSPSVSVNDSPSPPVLMFTPYQQNQSMVSNNNKNNSSAGSLFGGLARSFTNFVQYARTAQVESRLKSVDIVDAFIPEWMDNIFRPLVNACVKVTGLSKRISDRKILYYDDDNDNNNNNNIRRVYIAVRKASIRCKEVIHLLSKNNKAVIELLNELGDMIGKTGNFTNGQWIHFHDLFGGGVEQTAAFSIAMTYALVMCSILAISQKESVAVEGEEKSTDAITIPEIGRASEVICEITKNYANNPDVIRGASCGSIDANIPDVRLGLVRMFLMGMRQSISFTGTGEPFVGRDMVVSCSLSKYTCAKEREWICGTCGTIVSNIAKNFSSSGVIGDSSSNTSTSTETANLMARDMELLCSFTSCSAENCYSNQALTVVDSGFVTVADIMFPNDNEESRFIWASCLACATIARSKMAFSAIRNISSSVSIDTNMTLAMLAGLKAMTTSALSMAGLQITQKTWGCTTTHSVGLVLAAKQLCVTLYGLVEVSCMSTTITNGKTPSREQPKHANDMKFVENGGYSIQNNTNILSLAVDASDTSPVLKSMAQAISGIVESSVLGQVLRQSTKNSEKIKMALLTCSPAFDYEYLKKAGVKVTKQVHSIVEKAIVSVENRKAMASTAMSIADTMDLTGPVDKTELKSIIKKWMG